MVGTPARISKAGFSQRLKRVEAYSLEKMAARSPTGNATAIAMTVVKSVPLMSTIMPNLGLAKAADQVVEVRNSIIETSRKNAIVSKISTKIIPKVVNTEA